MSTGLYCDIITLETGEAFYILQNWNCPVGAWDWREYAYAYGPFASAEKAERHLSDNHANPGGWSEYEYKTGSSPAIDKLIADARAQAVAQARRPLYPRW